MGRGWGVMTTRRQIQGPILQLSRVRSQKLVHILFTNRQYRNTRPQLMGLHQDTHPRATPYTHCTSHRQSNFPNVVTFTETYRQEYWSQLHFMAKGTERISTYTRVRILRPAETHLGKRGFIHPYTGGFGPPLLGHVFVSL